MARSMKFWKTKKGSRAKDDEDSRTARCNRLDHGTFGLGDSVEKKWKDLRVGDLVRVNDGEYFPSDLLLISSAGPDGICYVETMNLDGETNLKVRQALEVTALEEESKLQTFKAELLCEPPNTSLYIFSGRLTVAGTELPVGPPQLLLHHGHTDDTGFKNNPYKEKGFNLCDERLLGGK